MLHDVVLPLLRPLAEDPPTITSAIGTLVGTILGGLAALLGGIASVLLALRKFRSGSEPDVEDDEGEQDEDPTPPRPSGRTQRVEAGWVGWAQRRIYRLEGDLLAAQQVAASATRKSLEAHERNDRLEELLRKARLKETDRRELFLRAGVDPDTGQPLRPPSPTPAP